MFLADAQRIAQEHGFDLSVVRGKELELTSIDGSTEAEPMHLDQIADMDEDDFISFYLN